MDFPPPAISIPPLYIKPALSSTSPLPSWQRYPIPKDLIGAPSLFQLCSKILIKYIDEVDDVGDMQYRTVKHIITKVTDPSKLKSIEHKCPQIAGECGDLWKKFIKRDFRADPEKYLPKDETLWYKVYAVYSHLVPTPRLNMKKCDVGD
ncbi:hypothetical protein BDZ91DRAFT_653994 [Kalaharituber pfeilii]|nr:hypothetical protein BDZ91DRAFT_653994 [Kalaharituber pfeilii]